MTTHNTEQNKVFKSLGIGLGVLALLALCVYGLMRLGASSNPGAGGGDAPAVTSQDWTRGNQYAKNVLIEYSDLQCPACAAYEPLIRQVTQDLDSQVLFVYRHFPLEQHKNAMLAAQATEAAGKQGKFWEMHDLLFERQKSWENVGDAATSFKAYAKELGLDETAFANDLTSDEVKKLVEEDVDGGIRAGVNATPSFYLNGKKIANPASYAELKELLASGS